MRQGVFTHKKLLLGASVIVLCASMPSAAYALDADALPSGGEVVGGSADFDYSTANELHINQHSDRVVIDWESFNIGSDALTEFHQNSSNALAVNRVTGEGLDPTQILGQLKANGRVLVLDRNGVIFGEGAVVDVGSIVVSTGDVDNAAVMGGGNIEITDISSDGFILNEGSINVSEAGLAAFVAPTVVNNGIINARLGRVQIGAGSQATIDLYGDGLMELSLDEGTQQTLINNGIILAEGGNVQIEAAAAKDIVDNLIVNTGIIAADSVAESNGTITLYAEGGTTYNDGYISAAGYQSEETGGNIEVLGDTVILDNNTLLDASGQSGGGDIKIGGDYLGTGDTPTAKNTYVAGGALILNDAITNGDGGRTIVWSDDTTEFYGSIYGRGGALGGNGGFVETSGKENLLAQGYVDLTAANGDKGTYLLDPADITVYGNVDPTFVSTDGSVDLASNLALWLDAADPTQVTLTYSTDSLGGATATGSIGTNTITTNANVSSQLRVGARIRLGAAGGVTTADTLGADTYTITAIAGTTITVEETLTDNYAGNTVYRGLASQWSDKSGNNNTATQGIEGRMPLWIDGGENGQDVLMFDGGNALVAADSPSLDLNGTQASLIAIANLANTGSSRMFFNKENSYEFAVQNNRFQAAISTTAPGGWNWGGSAAATANQNAIYHLNHDNTVWNFYIDGNNVQQIAPAAGQTGNIVPTNNLLTIGGRSNGNTLQFLGNYSEALIYDTTLTEEARLVLDQYQSAKWGIALDPIAGAGTEAAEAMDAANGFGAFTTGYLERLSDTADIVLQAGNSITLDLQGDNLSLSAGRNISLVTGAGDIDVASVGTITTGGGDVTFTTGGTGNINVNAALTLNAVGGGDLNFVSGGVTNNVGNVTVTEGTRLGDLYIAPPNTSAPIPPSVDNVISNPSGQVNNELTAPKEDVQGSNVKSHSTDCLVSMDGTGCVVQ